jgi:hypothetical protein
LKPKDYGDLDFLYDYLHHREIGRNESKIIWNMLVTDEDSYRDEVINFLVSEKGQKVIKKAIEQKHERLFHKELFKVASTELKSFLHAIFEYETFSRLLDDGFSEAMRELQVSASTISTQNLSQLKGFDVAHKGLKQQFLVTADALAVLEMDSQFKDTFNDVCNYESKTDLVKAIMDHHCEVQKNKGPRGTGKAPWIFPNQSGYTLNKFFKKDFIPTYDDRYVNFYRMNSLVHFAIDLGRMKDIG